MRKVLKTIFRPLAKIFYSTPWIYTAYHTVMAYLAASRAGFPAREMMCVGVTGTNGKTTTAYLIAEILRHAGHSVGLLSTVKLWVGEEEIINETKLTTQGPESYNALLRKMVAAGNKVAVIEVSSHALKQNRVAGTIFTGAAFTNITRDHLDYHKDFSEYYYYKSRLFRFLSARRNFPSAMSLNGNDPYSAKLVQFSARNKVIFNQPVLDYPNLTASEITTTESGSRFNLDFPTKESLPVNLHLAGSFNVDNALAAAGLAYGLGIAPEVICEGLSQAKPVPGRMETVQRGPFKVIIDYAHTPDGYEKTLSAARELTPGKLIVVFGAAGERDKGKRPILGKIASQYADTLLLTEEDPGLEDASKIIEEVLPGIDATKHSVGSGNLHVILDRKEALKKAVLLARPGDTVIALAMGAQTKMKKGSAFVPYNERATLEEILSHLT